MRTRNIVVGFIALFGVVAIIGFASFAVVATGKFINNGSVSIEQRPFVQQEAFDGRSLLLHPKPIIYNKNGINNVIVSEFQQPDFEVDKYDSVVGQSVGGYFYKRNNEFTGTNFEKSTNLSLELILKNDITDTACDPVNGTAPPALKVIERANECPQYYVGINVEEPQCHLQVNQDLCVDRNTVIGGDLNVQGTITGTFNISFNESCWRCESAYHCPVHEQNYEYPPVNGFTPDAPIDLIFSNRNGGAFARSIDRTAGSFGDCRGEYAMDMQLLRNTSSEVASGNYSFIGNGNGNTASGLLSAILNGEYGSATGDHALVGNGVSNGALASQAAVVNGESNTASGVQSIVLNGQLSTASGQYSLVGNGNANGASNTHATVLNGASNTASGSYSTILNGVSNTGSSQESLIGNGQQNSITLSTSSTILNGFSQTITYGVALNGSTVDSNHIGAGKHNTISHATVVDLGTSSLKSNSIHNGENNTITATTEVVSSNYNTILNGELIVITDSSVCESHGALNSITSSSFSRVFGFVDSITSCSNCDVQGSGNTISLMSHGRVSGFGNTLTSVLSSKHGLINGEGSSITDTSAGGTRDYNSIYNGLTQTLTETVASTIINGRLNDVENAVESTIGGGRSNSITGASLPESNGHSRSDIIGNGDTNSITYTTDTYSSVTGYNTINNGVSNVLELDGTGNSHNQASGNSNLLNRTNYGSIHGANNGITSADYSSVHQGSTNTITGDDSTVHRYLTIDNGVNNLIDVSGSTAGSHDKVLLGSGNSISSESTIVTVGGNDNVVVDGKNQFLYGVGLVSPSNSASGVNHYTAFGQYNTLAPGETNVTNRVFVIGDGASNAARSNLFSISSNGDVYTKLGGSYYTGGADFNEWFEHEEGTQLPVGATVVITEEGKIRRCKAGEECDGVYSKRGGFIGNHRDEYHEMPSMHTVGLLGQVEILKGDAVSPRWKAMPKRPAGNGLVWYLIR